MLFISVKNNNWWKKDRGAVFELHSINNSCNTRNLLVYENFVSFIKRKARIISFFSTNNGKMITYRRR